MKPKTRVTFSHLGNPQHIAEVEASDVLAAITWAVTTIVARGVVDCDTLLHWTNFGNTITVERIS